MLDGDGDLLTWDPDPDVDSSIDGRYNVYRGSIDQLAHSDWGDCHDFTGNAFRLEPAPPGAVFYLVTGVTDLEEGTKGFSTGTERSKYAPCAPR